MKTFLLVVAVLLLISRISSTPRNISKRLFDEYIKKSTSNMKETFSGKTEDEVDVLKVGTMILVLLMNAFLLWFYMHIASRFPDGAIYILSIIQVSTLIYSGYRLLSMKDIFTTNPEDHEFHRWGFLLNLLLDYAYYPMVIYALLG